MQSALIISAGDFSTIEYADGYLRDRMFDLRVNADLIIACDKGYEYAKKLGIIPNVVMGDFDSSVSVDTAKAYADSVGAEFIVHPIEKDDTDTMLGIKLAIERGAKDIYLCCCLGKRMDHTMANIQSMVYASKNNVTCRIITDNEDMVVLNPGKYSFSYRKDYSLSLFSMTNVTKGLRIENALYNADAVDITNTFPIGASNGWKEMDKSVEVSFEEGQILVIESSLAGE